MLEKWEDMDSITKHNESKHFKNFQKLAANFVAKPVEIAVLTPIER